MYKAILAVVLSTVVFFVAAGSAEAAGAQTKTASKRAIQVQSMYQSKYAGTADSPVKAAYQTMLQNMFKVAKGGQATE